MPFSEPLCAVLEQSIPSGLPRALAKRLCLSMRVGRRRVHGLWCLHRRGMDGSWRFIQCDSDLHL